jgi:hypothetical protein
LDAGHNDIPTIPNENDSEDSEGSNVEILDGASDVDIYEETELIKFSRMLCDAQKKALEEEKRMGNKRKTYNGDSQTTAYRRKRYRSDLAAKGYLPVHEFMKQIEAKKKNDKLTASQELTVEESEECSDDDAASLSWLGSNEQSISEDTEIEELAPAASGDCHQIAQGPGVSEERCRQVIQGPIATERRRQAAQRLAEEEEESTGSKDEDIVSKSKTHLGAVQFEDLRRRILMESAELSHLSSDGTPTFPCGRPGLRTACAELTAKMGDKGLDPVTWRRIQGMLGLLNLCLDEGLNLSWRKPSVVV